MSQLIQSLESRRQFSGSLSVSLDASGVLSVVGGAGREEVTISADASNLYVTPLGCTTLNGGTATFARPKFSVTGLFASLGAGSDDLRITSVDNGLAGTIDAGSGHDAIRITAARLTGVLILGGDGCDLVSLTDTTLQNSTISTGNDSDLVDVVRNTVFNASAITLGAGNDAIRFARNTVFGFTSIDGGGGLDVLLTYANTLPGGTSVLGIEYRIAL